MNSSDAVRSLVRGLLYETGAIGARLDNGISPPSLWFPSSRAL
jgi:hypothetical protein